MILSGAKRRAACVAERLGAVLEGTTELRGVTFQHWVHYRSGAAPSGIKRDFTPGRRCSPG
jgi:hypothetical protein